MDRHYHSFYASNDGFVCAERESDVPLHVKEALPFFFYRGHSNHARYGVYYLCQTHNLHDDSQKRFEKREHTIHLKSAICNGI